MSCRFNDSRMLSQGARISCHKLPHVVRYYGLSAHEPTSQPTPLQSLLQTPQTNQQSRGPNFKERIDCRGSSIQQNSSTQSGRAFTNIVGPGLAVVPCPGCCTYVYGEGSHSTSQALIYNDLHKGGGESTHTVSKGGYWVLLIQS